MLLRLQNDSLKLVHKPGTEMFISNTLRMETAVVRIPSADHDRHTVCSKEQEQYDVEQINQAHYLNITDQCLLQNRHHTDRQIHASIKSYWLRQMA